MRKTFLTLIAGLAMTAMLPAGVANATLYIFSFASFDGALTASGLMTVDSSDDVVAIAGSVSGLVDETISGVVADPGFPGAATSPDGSFVYDNLFTGADPYFDSDGVLFSTVENTNGYWNLWGNSPGNYSLWESVGSGNYPVEETGALTVVAAPEASTWTMMGLGFAALGLAGRRRGPRLPTSSLD